MHYVLVNTTYQCESTSHASSADLRAIRCSLALHPFGYGMLRPPSGSATLLSHSSSQSGLWIPPFISGDRRYGSVSSAWTLCIAPPPRSSVCTVGSTSILVVASGHPHGGLGFHHALAPPSSNAAMECSPGCGLGLHLPSSA